jgi:hypothetical protein
LKIDFALSISNIVDHLLFLLQLASLLVSLRRLLFLSLQVSLELLLFFLLSAALAFFQLFSTRANLFKENHFMQRSRSESREGLEKKQLQ